MKTTDSSIYNRTVFRAFIASSQVVRHARFLAILPCLLLPLSADQFGDFTYTDNGTTITITGYPATAVGAVDIPASIVGKPVTEIGNEAFYGCAGITAVTIPDSVMTIGSSAFAFCDALKGVALPPTVVSIGDYAFLSCDNLASVSIAEGIATIGKMAFHSCNSLSVIAIPASVTSVGSYAFDACSSLVAIAVAPANPNFSSACGVMFDKTQTTLLRYPAGLPGAYVVPNSVSAIAGSAFSSCRNLSAISLPDGLTSIGSYAFMSCESLNSISIPASVSEIAEWTFYNCTGFTSAILRAGLGSIGDYAFAGCTKLTGVTLPPGIASVGESAFSNCVGLTEIVIPNSVTSIGAQVFYACSNLCTITVDGANSNYCSIDGVLYNSLQTSLVQFPAGKSGTYVVPAGVTQIEDRALAGCGNLEAILVESANPSFSSIEGVLFNKLRTSLIQFPAGRSGAYVIPDGVTRVLESAFDRCSGLAAVSIPSGVISIGFAAFANCTSLTGITLPATISSISSAAFGGCSGLASAVFLGNAPALGSGYNQFQYTADNLTIYYFDGATGFTSPIWRGYPAVNMGAPTPLVTWLVGHDLPYDSDLRDDTNHDGVNLLMAYALNLDPRLNLGGSMPRVVLGASQMCLAFYGGRTDITYCIETSTDLQSWSTDGVTVSAPDVHGCRTATVDKASPARFMRLAISR